MVGIVSTSTIMWNFNSLQLLASKIEEKSIFAGTVSIVRNNGSRKLKHESLGLPNRQFAKVSPATDQLHAIMEIV